jgi:hypothetical protein
MVARFGQGGLNGCQPRSNCAQKVCGTVTPFIAEQIFAVAAIDGWLRHDGGRAIL